MKEILAVGLGGAVGAILRYLISILPYKESFPLHTFITNIIGAFVIGIIVGLIESETINLKHHQLFWKTGFCGGLTTFSTFSFESLSLIESRKFGLAAVYIVASVAFCILGVFLGRALTRH